MPKGSKSKKTTPPPAPAAIKAKTQPASISSSKTKQDNPSEQDKSPKKKGPGAPEKKDDLSKLLRSFKLCIGSMNNAQLEQKIIEKGFKKDEFDIKDCRKRIVKMKQKFKEVKKK